MPSARGSVGTALASIGSTGGVRGRSTTSSQPRDRDRCGARTNCQKCGQASPPRAPTPTLIQVLKSGKGPQRPARAVAGRGDSGRLQQLAHPPPVPGKGLEQLEHLLVGPARRAGQGERDDVLDVVV